MANGDGGWLDVAAISYQPSAMTICHRRTRPPGLRHLRLQRFAHALGGRVEVRLVDIAPDELRDAEAHARDRRAAEAGERIHCAADARRAVQPQALLG